MNADEARALRIRTRFNSGSFTTAQSGPWEALTPQIRDHAGQVRWEAGEVPVVFTLSDQGSWSLLSSRRLVWKVGEEVHAARYENLSSVNPKLRDWTERRAATSDWDSGPYAGANRLEVEEKNGARWKVPIESHGAALCGMIQALGAMIHDAKRVQTTA